MKRSILILLALVASVAATSLYAQTNFVANGDFETASGFPTTHGQLSKAVGWSNLNGGATWPYATPDFFHSSGSGGMQWPNTFYGQVVPYSGSGLAGFITSNGVVSEFREYLGYQLSAPFTVGQTYQVEFWLSSGTGNWYGNRGSNNIAVAFTMTQPSQSAHEPLTSVVPQLEIPTIVHHNDWRKYTFIFTPTQPFQYMTIGNFRSDLLTTWGTFNSGTNNIAYYFIDMISVQETSPLPLTSPDLRQVENPQGMELTWHVPTGTAGTDFSLERSTDQWSFTTVQEWSDIDNDDIDIYVTDREAQPGTTYYYRLRATTSNGQSSMSPIVEAMFGEGQAFVAGDVYPNPVADRFGLEFAAAETGMLGMQLVDASGRVVMETRTEVGNGTGHPSYELPSDLAAGVYVAQFTFGTEQFAKRVLVTGQL